MAKTFREWTPEQMWLLPPSVDDFVPKGHLAYFVRETVREDLDLSEIFASYGEERGYPPYHPALMTALLLYAYCQGVYSSRRIAHACRMRVDFMAVTGRETPDFRTICEFRRRHLAALRGLFRQVVIICRRAGLVSLGHVAIDGTKVSANASLHKAMSYERMQQEERRLKQEVQSWLNRAESADRLEDRAYGADRQGDEMPDWMADKAERRQKIREAKRALEREAKERTDREDPPDGAGGGATPEPTPQPKAQRNFTDPESRVLRTRSGFVQGYNAQLAVDARSQVIVAQEVVAQQNDNDRLVPMVDQVRDTTGRRPKEISADAGYLSEATLRAIARRRVRAYIATGRQAHASRAATNERIGKSPRIRAMRTRLRRGGFRGRYRLRKQTVEPVIGQIKAARGFRQFLLRGLEKVRGEWSLVATAHNLLKLAKFATT
jgi:transposase